MNSEAVRTLPARDLKKRSLFSLVFGCYCEINKSMLPCGNLLPCGSHVISQLTDFSNAIGLLDSNKLQITHEYVTVQVQINSPDGDRGKTQEGQQAHC